MKGKKEEELLNQREGKAHKEGLNDIHRNVANTYMLYSCSQHCCMSGQLVKEWERIGNEGKQDKEKSHQYKKLKTNREAATCMFLP